MSRSVVGRGLLAALIVLLVAAACGGDDDAADSTAPGSGAPDVEFTDGELPESLPDDFPIPVGAVVGTGMVNRTSGEVEAIVRIPAGVPAVAEFFDVNLANRGFSVSSSEASNGEGWSIAFERDGGTGSIDVSPVGEQISQSVIRYQQ